MVVIGVSDGLGIGGNDGFHPMVIFFSLSQPITDPLVVTVLRLISLRTTRDWDVGFPPVLDSCTITLLASNTLWITATWPHVLLSKNMISPICGVSDLCKQFCQLVLRLMSCLAYSNCGSRTQLRHYTLNFAKKTHLIHKYPQFLCISLDKPNAFTKPPPVPARRRNSYNS